jgi:hypothetical protein
MRSIMVRAFSEQAAYPTMLTTRLVSRRALDMFFEDGQAQRTNGNLNLQHNSISVLPKAERAKLNLYAVAPKRASSSRTAMKKRMSRLAKIDAQSKGIVVEFV